MQNDSTLVLTEADILGEVVAPYEPTMPDGFARAVLAVRFNESAQTRIREFLEKKNAGSITPTESANLDRYLHVGQFLDLMQAKARLSLQTPRSDRQ